MQTFAKEIVLSLHIHQIVLSTLYVLLLMLFCIQVELCTRITDTIIWLKRKYHIYFSHLNSWNTDTIIWVEIKFYLYFSQKRLTAGVNKQILLKKRSWGHGVTATKPLHEGVRYTGKNHSSIRRNFANANWWTSKLQYKPWNTCNKVCRFVKLFFCG